MTTSHSEKGLETLRQMNTVPSDWGLTPIKWETKLYPTMVWVECKTCQGEGSLWSLDGKTEKLTAKQVTKALGGSDYDVERASAFYLRNKKGTTQHGCPNCPWVRLTRTGRSYFWEKDGRQGFADIFREQGYVKELRNVERTVGTVLWAKGTQFDSRFQCSNGGDGLCHLCAKNIPSRRFVPVNGKSKDGVIHGAWVGEDCARKFFGIKAFKPEQVVLKEAR